MKFRMGLIFVRNLQINYQTKFTSVGFSGGAELESVEKVGKTGISLQQLIWSHCKQQLNRITMKTTMLLRVWQSYTQT